MSRQSHGWLIVLTMLVCGCQQHLPTYPVHGHVKFSDGQPLTGGTIECESLDHAVSAVGEIGPDGSFRLTTFEPGDGAVTGKHRVLIVADTLVTTGREDQPQQRAAVHPKYRRFETSGLELEILPEENTPEITVERR